MTSEVLCAGKTKLQILLKQCTYILSKKQLYRAPRSSFDRKTLKAPITFIHTHSHKVSFFLFFSLCFLAWVGVAWVHQAGVQPPLSHNALIILMQRQGNAHFEKKRFREERTI